MSQLTTDRPPAGAAGEPPSGDAAQLRPRRRLLRVLLVVLAVVLLLVVAAGAALWFGRGEARERRTDEALDDFRRSGTVAGDAVGRPAAGVYEAVAEGTESIGIPGFDESFGPNAPVTVTHGAGGCFTYRVDLNTHHWRSWTFCPVDGAGLGLAELATFSTRDVPGLDLSSESRYTCDPDVPYVWDGAAPGDRRVGRCTGVSDVRESVTEDELTLEVLDLTTLTVAGEVREVAHVRSTEALSAAQTGLEVDEWWFDVATGLPLRVVTDLSSTSDSTLGELDYVERATVELTSLVPRT